MSAITRTKRSAHLMDFRSDLNDAIVSEFVRQGISYPEHPDLSGLATRYLEMRVRRIEPVPRRVHFSEEIHDSLGSLARNTDPECREAALEAWRTAFYLCDLFERGESVLPHLSKGVNYTDPRQPDGLLWDYGMHHLHLSRTDGTGGFVRRSDWLLYVIVADQDVFFVDVRPHTDPERLQWVRQDLLTIVYRNWPELTESRLLRGVTGTTLTDAEKLVLRRKNVNVAHAIGGLAIAPLGLGVTGDGHSSSRRFLADKLLHELEHYQQSFDASRDGLREVFIEHGMADDAELDFRLMWRAELEVSDDQGAEMCSTEGFSGELWRIGFAIIEMNTRSIVIV